MELYHSLVSSPAIKGGERDLHRELLTDQMVRHRWLLSERVLSASFEDAVIYQIELKPSSLSIHNEENVVAFHDLVIPAVKNHGCLDQNKRGYCNS